MFIISKVIAKEWFKALFGALIILFLLITIGDIVNGFLLGLTPSHVFIEYSLKLPEMLGKILPICSLLASLFAFNKLKAHSELMAILSAGFSVKRIYGLILLCSLSIAFLQFLNLGFIQPLANEIKRKQFEKSRKDESKYIAKSQIGASGLLWYKTKDYFVSFSAFDNKQNSLQNISIYFFNSKNILTKILKADRANFFDEYWDLVNVSIVDFLESLSFPKFESHESYKLDINETPADFDQFKSDITTLDFFTFYRFISNLTKTGINTTEYKVMLYEKVSLTLICIVFALFPVSGVFNPNRRSSSAAKSIVFTLIFSIVFWLVYSSVIALGFSEKLPAIVATMSIPVIFIGYISVVYYRNRTL